MALRVLVTAEVGAEQVEGLRAQFPSVEFVVPPDEPAALAALPAVDVVFGRVDWRALDDAVRLRWVQVPYAGVNSLPLEKLAARGIVLTNSSGAFGVPIAETILGMMLAFTLRLPALLEAQRRREWVAARLDREKQQLDGQALLIVGLGDIGGALARRAKALGMTVLGVRRSRAPAPPGVDESLPLSRLHEALGRADHAALCLPLTAETAGYLGAGELRAMRPTAFVYNVGRGASIQREALLRALREGWIAGAGLDVTDPEPLPPDDPLWDFPNVILTQHTSGSSPHYERTVTALFAGNLRRFLAGEPLEHIVDAERGY